MTMIGQLLDGRYLVTQKLGEGGFGHTYLAQDTRIPHETFCVVKHLQPANTDREYLQVASRLFTSEAKILARLGGHDRLPRLLAYFQEGGEFFLVEDFVEGRSLEVEVAQGHRLGESQVMQILDELLEVLEYMHGHGVIHRDIKPDNVIRRQSDGKLVLIDFGAIKQIQTQLHQEPQQALTVAIGTLGYMPSEQAQGKPRPNSDVYALGMIGIQSLTGIMPKNLATDDDSGELIWQHLVAERSPLVEILTKMTRYHYKDRYSTATEVRQALALLNVSDDNIPPTIVMSQATDSTIISAGISAGQSDQALSITVQMPPPVLPVGSVSNPPKVPLPKPPQYMQAAQNAVTLTGEADHDSSLNTIARTADSYGSKFRGMLLWLGALVIAIAGGAVLATRHSNIQTAQDRQPNPLMQTRISRNLSNREDQIPLPPSATEGDPAPSSTPQPSPIASEKSETIGSFSEMEAIALVTELVASKGAIFAPPFDLELLAELTTGDAYAKRRGAIVWLKQQNAYYSFDVFTVKSAGVFGIQNNQANLTVEISENPTLYVNGKVVPRESVPTRGTYVCTFLFVDGKWKIANLTKL
jgi:serine/threonine-protein kinase